MDIVFFLLVDIVGNCQCHCTFQKYETFIVHFSFCDFFCEYGVIFDKLYSTFNGTGLFFYCLIGSEFLKEKRSYLGSRILYFCELLK